MLQLGERRAERFAAAGVRCIVAGELRCSLHELAAAYRGEQRLQGASQKIRRWRKQVSLVTMPVKTKGNALRDFLAILHGLNPHARRNHAHFRHPYARRPASRLVQSSSSVDRKSGRFINSLRAATKSGEF